MFFDPPDDSPLATSVPCVVELSIGGGAEMRHYGPFSNLLEARAWIAKQQATRFSVIILRRTDLERDYNDFYGPQVHDNDVSVLVNDLCDLDEFKKWQESQ